MVRIAVFPFYPVFITAGGSVESVKHSIALYVCIGYATAGFADVEVCVMLNFNCSDSVFCTAGIDKVVAGNALIFVIALQETNDSADNCILIFAFDCSAE